MALVTAAGTAMTELLCTKQTLSEVRQALLNRASMCILSTCIHCCQQCCGSVGLVCWLGSVPGCEHNRWLQAYQQLHVGSVAYAGGAVVRDYSMHQRQGVPCLLPAQVQRDNAGMVKDLGSLSAAEAEASAQRSSLKTEVRRCG